MSLLFNPITAKHYQSFKDDAPQCLVLAAPAGSGKETVLKQLAQDIMGKESLGRLFEILPEADKDSIGIDAVRELKLSLRLKSNDQRVVLINQAEKLTQEAQNSILKLLEDTPKNTHFLMGVNGLNGLLETILSRSVLWNFVNPTTGQIKEYFSSFDGPKLDKAIAISGNRVGLIQAILNQDNEHPLIQAIDSAKLILSSNHFDRLLKIETLHKDAKQTLLILEALELISKSALESSAAKNDIKQVKQWHRRLNVVMEATQLIRSNVNTKLVLSKTFLVI
jgi:hypothetical protein